MYAMWRNPSGLFAPNKYGAIVVEPESSIGGPLRASTQLLESGEVWGLAKWLFVTHRPAYGNFIPAIAFERLYQDMLPRYVDLPRLFSLAALRVCVRGRNGPASGQTIPCR